MHMVRGDDLAVFPFTTWGPARWDGHRVVCRPGLRGVLHRLPWLAVALTPMLILYFSFAPLLEALDRPLPAPGASPRLAELQESLRGTMSEDEWDALMREHEADMARKREEVRRENARIRGIIVQAGQVIGAVLLVLGALPAVSCLWRHVTIARDVNGALTVTSRGIIMPSRKTWPKGAFTSMEVSAHEVWRHDRRFGRYFGRWMHEGWRWKVCLAGVGGSWVEFWPYRQRAKPTGEALPGPVSALVQGLNALLGLSYGPPAVYEADSSHRTPTGRRMTMTSSEPRVVSSQTFSSLDEIPPELRERFGDAIERARQGASAEASAHVTVRGAQVTVRDQDGRAVTYDSLDDAPPEMRARLEEMMARARGGGGRAGASPQITITDSQGNTHTYASPDEMPPHVRALYDRMRRGH